MTVIEQGASHFACWFYCGSQILCMADVSIIKSSCPHCQTLIEAPSTYSSEEVTCPNCNANFVLSTQPPPIPSSHITHGKPTKISEHRRCWLSIRLFFRKCFLPVYDVLTIPGLWLLEIFGGSTAKNSAGKSKQRDHIRLARAEKSSELSRELAFQKAALSEVKSRIDAQRRQVADDVSRGIRPPQHGSICTTCGVLTNPVSHTKGSCLIEGILWLFFLIPGLIYSIWRITSREDVCPACKGKPIPINSPQGQELWTRFHKKE